MLSFTAALGFVFGINFANGNSLKSWTEIDGMLARADRFQYVAYNADSSYPECVWIFGGQDADDLYCFNINTYTRTYWGELDATNSYYFQSLSTPGSIALSDDNGNDYLYILTDYAYLIRYNLNTKTVTSLSSVLYGDIRRPCMVQNPSNSDELLIVGGYNDDEFYIYTISTNTITQGQSLDDKIYYQTCIAVNNDYYSEHPYMYVLQGYTDLIYRLDTNVDDLSNEHWHTLTTKLVSPDSSCDLTGSSLRLGGSFLWNNLIYIIGGYDTTGGDCILTFNIQDDSVDYYGEFPMTISRFGITLAGSRVVVAGGCTGSATDLDHVFISNDLNNVTNPSPSPTTQTSGLKSWTEMDGKLTRADRYQYVAYNSDSSYPECVWIFGGQDADDLYCFNINTYDITYWGELDATNSYQFRELSTPQSIALSDDNGNDYLYILTDYAYLIRYNLNTNTVTLLSSVLYGEVRFPCMVQNPSNSDQLLFVGGSNDDEFYIYTISTNTITQGQSLDSTVLYQTCIAINNEYYESQPYFYVLQGLGTAIQRLDISVDDLANEHWHTLTTQLATSDSNCDTTETSARMGGGFLWQNIIYVIGGYDGNDNDCILEFNIEDHSVSYHGDFPMTISRYGITMVQDRVVIAGGCTGNCADMDSVFISNHLGNESNPSPSPTSSALKSWTEMDGKLTRADRYQYVAYNGDSSYPECAWIFGGNDADDLYCFNINTYDITYWGELDATNSYYFQKLSTPASIALSDGNGNDYLYILTDYAYLIRYNLNTNTVTLLSSSLYGEIRRPCMVQNPSNSDELLIVGGNIDDEFYIYTISTNTVTPGQSLDDTVRHQTCIAIDNEYYELEPYFYVLQGDSAKIHRLDVSVDDLANEHWHILTTELKTSDSSCDITETSARLGGGFLWQNIIYVVGGYDTNDNDCILEFNIQDNSVSYHGDFPMTISRYGITMVEDRVLIAGGCTGNCADMDSVFISNHLSTEDTFITPNTGLESWTELDGKLARNDRQRYAAYNGDSSYPECVWIFGGLDADDLYCFNINTYDVTYWGELDATNSYQFRELSTPASIALSDDNGNDYLYILTDYAYLIRYNLNTKTVTLLSSFLYGEIRLPCMVQNPSNSDELLIVGGYNDDEFYIYTISTNTITQGQSLDDKIYYQTCIAVNNEYYSEHPYMYVLQGYTESIFRLDISVDNLANQPWHTLTTTLESPDSDCDLAGSSIRLGGGFLWNNIIYIIGGYDSTNGDCILEFNIEDETVSYHGEFPMVISRYGITLAGDRAVIAAGCTGSTCTDMDSIFISNPLGDTLTTAPTQRPTTLSPTMMPSKSPTEKPITLTPTKSPVDNIIPTTSSPTKSPNSVITTCDENKYIGVNIDTYNWEKANDDCLIEYGTTLATITSDNDMDEAILAVQDAGFYETKTTKFFIGLIYNAINDDWEWEDGTISDYIYNDNFVHSTSNAYCSQVYWQDDGEKYWQSVRCNKATSYYLCNNPNCYSTQ